MKVLLGVSGSVAAIVAPSMVMALLEQKHNVKVILTSHASYFFDGKVIEGMGAEVYYEANEWPQGRYNKKDEPQILHIQLRNWADVLVVAPLTANTLAKFSHGIADSLLSSVYLAWNRERPIVLAPAMNTNMWKHPMTQENLTRVLALNENGYTIRVVEPIEKRLACGDIGVGAMAKVDDIVACLHAV